MNQKQTCDITSEADIRVIVEDFYGRIEKDSLLAQVFEVAKVDREEFTAAMSDFWSTLLLRSHRYHEKPYPKHERLALKRAHFERWIVLFFEAIDTRFAGPKADELKQWAKHIARVFQERLAAEEASG